MPSCGKNVGEDVYSMSMVCELLSTYSHRLMLSLCSYVNKRQLCPESPIVSRLFTHMSQSPAHLSLNTIFTQYPHPLLLALQMNKKG